MRGMSSALLLVTLEKRDANSPESQPQKQVTMVKISNLKRGICDYVEISFE